MKNCWVLKLESLFTASLQLTVSVNGEHHSHQVSSRIRCQIHRMFRQSLRWIRTRALALPNLPVEFLPRATATAGGLGASELR